MKKVKIFLADDHTILREGLRYIIEKNADYIVAGEEGDGRKAYEKIEKIKPDIAVVDISMPSMTGIEISKKLKKYCPEIKIIILSQHDNREYIQELLKNNIDGYVLKDNAGDDLLKAISEVLSGNVFLSPRITTMLVSNIQKGHGLKNTDNQDSQFEVLTSREREIVKMIAEGKTSKEIASILFISEKTVNNHRTNIMNKLDLHKNIELVRYAIKQGIIEE